MHDGDEFQDVQPGLRSAGAGLPYRVAYGIRIAKACHPVLRRACVVRRKNAQSAQGRAQSILPKKQVFCRARVGGMECSADWWTRSNDTAAHWQQKASFTILHEHGALRRISSLEGIHAWAAGVGTMLMLQLPEWYWPKQWQLETTSGMKMNNDRNTRDCALT